MKIYTICLTFLLALTACNTPPSNASRNLVSSDTSSEKSVIALQSENKSVSSSIATSKICNEAAGLNLPVANVSAKYAKEAQSILDSFYSACEKIPQKTLNTPIQALYSTEDQPLYAECQLLGKWCYPIGSIDFYFLDFADAAAELRKGKTLPEVSAICVENAKEYYVGNSIGVLYKTENNPDILGEAQYSVYWQHGIIMSRVNTMYTWENGPVSALFINDELMDKLKEKGMNLSETTAMSFTIPAHSDGIYFTDGNSELYMPTLISSDSTQFITVGELCDISVLIESLESYSP